MATEKTIPRSPIGEALIAEGILNEKQLRRAIRVQQLLEQPKHLGDVLIDLGYAKKQSINDAIKKHGASMRLGDILVEQGIISEDSLKAALTYQKERHVQIGVALVEIGALNEHALAQNLAHQLGVPFIEPRFGMIDTEVFSGLSPDFLASHCFVPFSKNDDGIVTAVLYDLQDEEARQAIENLYQGQVEFALGPRDALLQAIEDFRRFRRGGDHLQTITSSEHAVVELVNDLLCQAIEERASDIHIEPMSNKVRVRYRIDGVLVYKTDLPLSLLTKVISRIKIMAEANISEHFRHQGGRISYTHNQNAYDLRVSIFVSVHGESAVLRILNPDMALVNMDELGMNPPMLDRYRNDVLDVPTGVVLITGPTGSGKTTTLYSSIDYSNDIGRKIITAEDPAEFTIDGIIQCSINDKAGRTFDATLREVVRQDPDIIVLGEIRDKTTAQVAIQAALTGHKVFSTFHTEDTIGGLLRLIDMEIETFLISSTVISVLAQRLLRRICPHCATAYLPHAKEILSLGLDVSHVREFEFKRGRGCNRCAYTGYRGRIGVYELLVMNEPVKEAILQKKTAQEIRQISMESTGLVSMREDGISKVIAGHTTLEEVLYHTPRTFGIRPLKSILNLCK
jgi:type IV pilus assembly protein PilB